MKRLCCLPLGCLLIVLNGCRSSVPRVRLRSSHRDYKLGIQGPQPESCRQYNLFAGIEVVGGDVATHTVRASPT